MAFSEFWRNFREVLAYVPDGEADDVACDAGALTRATAGESTAEAEC